MVRDSTGRDSTTRKMTITEKHLESMEYPYECIESEDRYVVENILRNICIAEEAPDPGNFPHNIEEHYWIHEGENDGDDWISAGKLTNGSYFLYTGSCDYTGFDCQGGMFLWVNSSWDKIIDHGMDTRIYKMYMEETQKVD